ncbi:unnamed protein product [Paramecium pentaurelia]|uniref:PH domain-containing protein n=1 Tax=Paramecium pentaurelia TaxID=43138 RepID=A0A8S1TGT8_9CILI|nr:unnamed protein product [Paramecium pentaurelia]
MNFLSLFTSSTKQQQKLQKIKIYKDEQCQNYFQNLNIEDNTQCQKILDQIDIQNQLGDDVRKVLLLFTCQKDKKCISQRIINKQEQIAKILQNAPQNLELYIIYQEIKLSKLLETQSYHQKIWNHININSKDHSFRQGTLLKKGKTGQFRERLFKLQKDTLIYEKQEKHEKNKTKQSCISLDSMQIEKQPDKNLTFLIKCDQKIYQIKAQSRTDFDGWLYSLHNQIMKWKEVKLLLDYDKKIEQCAYQKVEKLKSLPSQIKSIKFITQNNTYITKQFLKYLENNRSELDNKLFGFLQLTQESETLQQGSKNYKQILEKKELLYQEIQEMMKDDEHFSKFEKIQSTQFKQEITIYFDKQIVPDFLLQIQQSQIIQDFSIHQFKQFYKFPLFDLSGFYSDPTDIVNPNSE